MITIRCVWMNMNTLRVLGNNNTKKKYENQINKKDSIRTVYQ